MGYILKQELTGLISVLVNKQYSNSDQYAIFKVYNFKLKLKERLDKWLVDANNRGGKVDLLIRVEDQSATD